MWTLGQKNAEAHRRKQDGLNKLLKRNLRNDFAISNVEGVTLKGQLVVVKVVPEAYIILTKIDYKV